MRRPGRLAQLGEHQLDKLGVTGSSPVPPTTETPAQTGVSLSRQTTRRRRSRATTALVITLRRSDNGEVPLGPHDSRVELGVLEPPNLVVDAVGKIESVLEWRYLIL